MELRGMDRATGVKSAVEWARTSLLEGADLME